MTFDATPGGSESTSYITKDDAKDYFKHRLHSELWANFPDQKAALMTATRLLDRWMKWSGVKASGVQSLAWPRMGVVDKEGYSVPSDIVPRDVQEATCELAYYSLEEDLTAPDDMDGIHSLKVSSLQIVADDGFTKGSVIPDAVIKSLSGLIEGGSSSSTVRLMRV